MVLPPEIISEFLRHVAFPKDLRNFSLVCQSWYPIAQSMLFRVVALTPRVIPLFCSIIEEFPHLYFLIKNLTIHGSAPLMKSLMGPLQKFRESSNVTSLYLSMSASGVNRGILALPPDQLENDATTYEPADFSLFTNFVCLFPKLESLDVEEVPALRWNVKQHQDFGLFPKLPGSLRILGLGLHPHIMDTLLQWLLSHEYISRLNDVDLSSQNHASPLPGTVQTFMDALEEGPELVRITLSGMLNRSPSLYSGFSKNTNLKHISINLYITARPSAEWSTFCAMLLSSIPASSVEQVHINFVFSRSGPSFLDFDWASVNRILSTPKFSRLTVFHISCSTHWLEQEEVHSVLSYPLKQGILRFEWASLVSAVLFA